MNGREQQLLDSFPQVKWLDAEWVETPDGGRWLVCQLCTAMHGLKTVDVARTGFTQRSDHYKHLVEVHGL